MSTFQSSRPLPPRSRPPAAPPSDPGPSSASTPETLMLVAVTPNMQTIDALRTFVTVYMTRRISRQVADKIGTTCHELLENAVRYNVSGGEIGFEIKKHTGKFIEIRVTNACTEESRKTLHGRIAEIATGNAARLYQDALRTNLLGGKASMLGLVRIRHEARMTLEAIDERGKVMICARLSEV
jgi:hypothetical protein